MKRIASRGLLTVSLVVVLLGATAGSASASVLLDPTSTNFGDRQVGTTSLPQAFTLTVKAPCFSFLGLEICTFDTVTPAPSVTGVNASDFAQTSDCPPFMFSTTSSGTSCTINATFTPTSTGAKAATLNAGGLPATLTGNGVAVPTPPTPPQPGPSPPQPPPTPPTLTQSGPAPGFPALQLDLDAKKQELKKKLTFFATTNVASSLITGGSVKQTVKQLAAAAKTQIKATLKPKKFKQLAQTLDRTGKAKTKIEATATSPTSGTVIAEIKVKLKD